MSKIKKWIDSLYMQATGWGVVWGVYSMLYTIASSIKAIYTAVAPYL